MSEENVMGDVKRADIQTCLMMLHRIMKSDLRERMERHDVPRERREELHLAMDHTFMALVDVVSRELGAGEASMPEIMVAEKKSHLSIADA